MYRIARQVRVEGQKWTGSNLTLSLADWRDSGHGAVSSQL